VLGIQLWFDYFVASSFKALGIHFSRKAEERDASVAGAFPLVYVVIISVYPFVAAMPLVTPINAFSVQSFEYLRSDFT